MDDQKGEIIYTIDLFISINPVNRIVIELIKKNIQRI